MKIKINSYDLIDVTVTSSYKTDETSDKVKIDCPYCFSQNVVSENNFNKDTTLRCVKCGKAFFVKVKLVPELSTYRFRQGRCSICGAENTPLSSAEGLYHDTCDECTSKICANLIYERNNKRGGTK